MSVELNNVDHMSSHNESDDTKWKKRLSANITNRKLTFLRTGSVSVLISLLSRFHNPEREKTVQGNL